MDRAVYHLLIDVGILLIRNQGTVESAGTLDDANNPLEGSITLLELSAMDLYECFQNFFLFLTCFDFFNPVRREHFSTRKLIPS